MTFKQWLDDRSGEDSPVGDLARDAQRVTDFPLSDNFGILKGYLQRRKACPEAIRALRKAHRDYCRERRPQG